MASGVTRLQVSRRLIQLVVILGLFLIPALGRYQALRNQIDQVGIESELGPRLIDSVLGKVHDPEPYTTALRGSVWTMRIGSLVISDPLAGADFVAASKIVMDPFLLSILLPLLATMLLGRVFCGWICPGDMLFELGSRIRSFAGVETDVTFSRSTKYAVLLLGLMGSAYLGSQTMAEIYPPRLVSGEIYGWIWYHRFGMGAWFLLFVLSFEIFVSKRFWCRYVCPGGAIYILFSRRRRLRLQVDRPLCDGCRDCEDACEFGLKPEAKEVGPECNHCGDCVPSCHTQALSIGWGERLEV
jgi:ferredoxin-type protein NapH